MKCPNCPKFTTKGTDTEPDGDLEVDDSGVISGDVRIFNECEECGTELEETTFSVDIDLASEVAQHRKDRPDCANESLSVESEIERTDEMRTKDRHGRPIKRSRYMRRLYGISVNATLTCDGCGEQIASGEFSDQVAASGMEWIA